MQLLVSYMVQKQIFLTECFLVFDLNPNNCDLLIDYSMFR